MKDAAIRELTTLDEVRALSDILLEYILFVTDEVRRHFDVHVDGPALHAKTMGYLDTFLAPLGRSFVAEVDGTPVGMVFLRPSGPEAVEIKRLYVLPEGRGLGLGSRLVDHAIGAAREMGATQIFLDSTKNLKDAARIYESRGFVYTGLYPGSDHADDADLLPHMIFMRLDL